ncbi:MAG: MFS transporter, partial [bacterium]
LTLCAISMWLMSRVTVHSSWLVLLPGFLVGGVGIGMVNAPLASTAVSTVRVERAGMATGINNTFRQVGIATGIAALGAIFQSQVHGKVVSALAGLPNAGAIAHSFSNGRQAQAIAAAPAGLRGHLTEVAKASFVSGFHEILIVGAIVAFCGAVLAALLIRPQDFVTSQRPPASGTDQASFSRTS